jgi:hypothetical protein
MLAKPTPDDFLHALDQDLQLHSVAFDLGGLITFVESCWPRIVDAPDVPAWADAFVEQLAVVTAGSLA